MTGIKISLIDGVLRMGHSGHFSLTPIRRNKKRYGKRENMGERKGVREHVNKMTDPYQIPTHVSLYFSGEINCFELYFVRGI